jgi:hypothetical protein
MPKHVGVENLERINKTSTTSLNIYWSFCKRYYKMLGSTIKIKLIVTSLINKFLTFTAPEISPQLSMKYTSFNLPKLRQTVVSQSFNIYLS